LSRSREKLRLYDSGGKGVHHCGFVIS